MNSIDTQVQAAALLRARTRLAAARSPAAQRPVPSTGVTSAQDPARLAAQRVRALALDDPATPRKAVRVYLEAVLLQEFGQSLLEDPGFPAWVDDVQQQMEAEPELAAAIRRVASLLLQRSREQG